MRHYYCDTIILYEAFLEQKTPSIYVSDSLRILASYIYGLEVDEEPYTKLSTRQQVVTNTRIDFTWQVENVHFKVNMHWVLPNLSIFYFFFLTKGAKRPIKHKHKYTAVTLHCATLPQSVTKLPSSTIFVFLSLNTILPIW